LEAVFIANNFTDTDKQNKYRKIHRLIKYNSNKANNAEYSKTKLPRCSVTSYDTRSGNTMGLFYSTMLPSPIPNGVEPAVIL